MRLIQLLLVMGTIASLALYFKYFRSVLRDRLVALLLFAMAVAAIVFPSVTTIIANYLGVGRGTDLVIYIIGSASVFAFILIGIRLIHMENMITELVRYIAILKADGPDKPK